MPGSLGPRSIIWVNQYASAPGEPGGSRHYDLASALAQTGWKVEVVASDLSLASRKYSLRQSSRRLRPLRRREGRVPFTYLWTSTYQQNDWRRLASMVLFGVSTAIALTFRRHGKQTIFIGSSPHLFAALGAWVAARIRRRPFVFEVRDLWPESYSAVGDATTTGLAYRSLHQIAQLLYRRANRIIVLAEPNREKIAAQGVDVAKIFYLPNGVNLEDFTVNPQRLSELDGHQIRFIYAGAHGPANGLEVVAQACAELERRGGSDIEVVLAGDGPAKPALVRLATSLGLHNLQFFDPVAKEHIPALLETAHAGLMILAPSELFEYGISPNKLFDYLAAGLPVVTNVPGLVTDIVVEAGAGIFCEAGSAEALATAMTAMATALRQDPTRFGNGRAYVAQYFDRRILAERLSEMLEQLLTS